MNTELMFSSKKENWETPQDFFNKLNEEFRFTLDAAASDDNAKCANYFTKEQDGLVQSWGAYSVVKPSVWTLHDRSVRREKIND